MNNQNNNEDIAPMRAVINSNIDVKNVIEREDMSILAKTFEYIYKFLATHCGPYSRFAVLTSPVNPLAEPIFTTDGINSIRALEFASPMQTFAKNTIAYIGKRVETAAGDGTTTAMMFAASMLHEIMSKLKRDTTNDYNQPIMSETDNIPFCYQDFVDAYKYFTDEIIKKLESDQEEIKKSIPRPKWTIAYMQAYTSSHGNIQLAKTIADLFESMPEEAIPYLCIEKSKYETDEPYSVYADDSQFTIENCTIFPKSALKDEYGVSYKLEATTPLIITRSGLLESAMDSKEVIEEIEKYVNSGEPLCVICNSESDNVTLNRLASDFATNMEHKVAIIRVPMESAMNDVGALFKLCHQDTRNTLYYQSGGFEGIFYGDTFKITKGLLPEGYDNILMPYMVNPSEDQKLYDFVKGMDRVIEDMKRKSNTAFSNDEIAARIKYRMKLTCTKRTFFMIGGSAYDNAYMVDVAVDTILAVKNTLKYGFTFGGMYSFIKALASSAFVLVDSLDSIWASRNAVKIDALDYIKDAAYTTAKNIRSILYPNTAAGVLADAHAGNSWNDFKSYCKGLSECKTIDDYAALGCPPIQPITTDKEMLLRFGEVALKYIFADRVIIPGGVYLPKSTTLTTSGEKI